MAVIENVLAKMQTTPQFRPMSADTFSDWSIEAGDIITVEVDGREETLPVFSSDMEWGGAAMATLSCSGSQERPTLSKAERQSYSAFGGVSRQIQKTNDKILEDRKELVAALNGEDGAPEDLAAGLQSYVRYDLENSEAYAESVLFAQIGEKARAEIGVYAVMGEDGEPRTFAEILAEQITLRSEMNDAKTELDTKVDSKEFETVTDELHTLQTAQTELTTRVGDAESALSQKAERETVDTLDGKVTKAEKAQSDLTTRVGNAESALSQKAESKTVTELNGRVKKTEEAQTELTTRVGNVEGGLSTKVSSTALTETLKNYALASALKDYLTVTAAAELYVTDEDVAGIIGTYIVTDAAGNKASLAAILADIIKLQGDTEILGNLSIKDGRLNVTKGITAGGLSSILGDLYINGAVHPTGGVTVNDKNFTPTPITSTTGTVLVLGIA